MGLAATDGRLIRPADEPTTAKVAFDWADDPRRGPLPQRRASPAAVEGEAARTGVGRGQELSACRGWTPSPAIRWNGMGEDSPAAWTATRAIPASARLSEHASTAITRAGTWASRPACRSASARKWPSVRNAQLVWRGSGPSCRKRNWKCRTRWPTPSATWNPICHRPDRLQPPRGGPDEVEAVKAAYDTGTVTLDVLLEAQRTLADAESNYYPHAGQLQRGDRPGPLPQGLAAGV